VGGEKNNKARTTGGFAGKSVSHVCLRGAKNELTKEGAKISEAWAQTIICESPRIGELVAEREKNWDSNLILNRETKRENGRIKKRRKVFHKTLGERKKKILKSV